MSGLHWGGVFIDEDSALRKYMLKRYAWLEVRILAVMNWMMRLPVMKNPFVKKAAWHSLAKFVGQHMIVSQVFTLEDMLSFIDGLPADSAIAVGPCRCRLATHNCAHPLETDIVIMTGTPIWLELFPTDYRLIDREEARRIVAEGYEVGLVPMLDRHMYYKDNANYFVICNCCGCSCLPILAYRTFKELGYHYIPSAWRSAVDRDKCTGDGACVEACAFNERVVVAGKARVLDCQGCGQCVRVCPHGAASMTKR
jgi:NAD-dependent dihydropyrimidine dehydrogenase PreA subunit